MHRLSRFLVVGALALLATPASAQVVRAGDDVPGQPGAVPVTSVDGRTAKVPVYVPVRTDGTVIDPMASAPPTGASAQQVQGNVAAGNTELGNPLLLGGRIVTGLPNSLSTNQRGYLWLGTLGQVTVGGFNDQTNGTATFIARGDDTDGQSVMNSGRLITLSRNTYFNGSTWDRAPGNASGGFVVSKGGSSVATAQVSVGTTATLVAAARAGRQKITVSVGAANACAFGNVGVTTTTGFPLQPVAGAAITLDTAAALYAVCSAATTISALEQF